MPEKTCEKHRLTTDQVLQRYPRLVSHMICDSLGYFTPGAAANALKSYIEGEECWCEWYMHMSGVGNRSMIDVGKKVVSDSFRFRHNHIGCMAEYRQARALVEQVRQGGQGPLFASWF